MDSKNIIFIRKSKIIHGGKYDYSRVEYVNCKHKVDIICQHHGIFNQTPSRHINGNGCQKCSIEKRSNMATKNTETFIKESVITHGDKYDYSKTNYINSTHNVEIICKIHGVFWQSPRHHKNGSCCPKCVKCSPLSQNDFIERAKLAHGNKYDYSFVNYESTHKKINIKCKKHGLFTQIAANHFNGAGCPTCAGCKKDNKYGFVEKSMLVHGDKYDYSNVEYINNKAKVKILCKNHGEFSQSPVHHKNGSGCPKCKSSHGERLIRLFLKNKSEKFAEQVKFPTCRNKKELLFDFYLEGKNILIEFQGEHHFKPKTKNRMFGAKEPMKEYNKVKINDAIKSKWCDENKIKLILIDYRDIGKIEEILTYMIYNVQ